MPTEFWFEIQHFNFDWQNYSQTSSRSQKCSTVTTAVQSMKICRRKKVILCTPYLVLSFTEFFLNFKNIVKFTNFTEF